MLKGMKTQLSSPLKSFKDSLTLGHHSRANSTIEDNSRKVDTQHKMTQKNNARIFPKLYGSENNLIQLCSCYISPYPTANCTEVSEAESKHYFVYFR